MKLNEVARCGPYVLTRMAVPSRYSFFSRYWIRMQGGEWYCAFDAARIQANKDPAKLAALRDLLLVAIFDAK
jgi:hypothetical protein